MGSRSRTRVGRSRLKPALLRSTRQTTFTGWASAALTTANSSFTEPPVVTISSTISTFSPARHYAEAIFGVLGMDAATVQPTMGHDSMAPFIADPAKGAFVLCLTSNPGAGDFQRHPPGDPFFMRVAAWAQSANRRQNLGLVVGATRPDDLDRIRKVAPDLPFLMPGVGAQGGDLQAALSAGRPTAPVLIAVSRGILYAGDGTLDDITGAVADYNAAIRAAAR